MPGTTKLSAKMHMPAHNTGNFLGRRKRKGGGKTGNGQSGQTLQCWLRVVKILAIKVWRAALKAVVAKVPMAKARLATVREHVSCEASSAFRVAMEVEKARRKEEASSAHPYEGR